MSSLSRGREPSNKELDSIELPNYGKFCETGSVEASKPQTEAQTPDDVHTSAWTSTQFSNMNDDLERSGPPSPQERMAASILPSFSYPRMNRYRVLAACFTYFGNGLSDSAAGALLPYIEDHYHIGFAIVSLIWITNALGFVLSAFFNDAICARLGRARSLMVSEFCMMAAYVIISCTPPFPAVVVAYLIMGFGNALNLALNNVFCANLADSTVILGCSHGSYGIGGIVAPILATAMVNSGILWSRFYTIALGVRTLCFFFDGWSFWNYEKEGFSQYANSLQQLASRQAEDVGEVSKLRMLRRALKGKTTLIGALLIFSYQGAEVAESGWFISYLINYRNASPAKVGYVTAGFWGGKQTDTSKCFQPQLMFEPGITVGRFVLTHVAHRVGERLSVFALGFGAIVFQLMAWQIPSVIGDSVSVAILGLLLGPIYPCAQTIFTRLLPANVQVIAVGFISSAGSSGGAVVPFLTGLIAQGAGTWVLHPICVGFFVLMLGCWAWLPRVKKVAAE